MIVGDIVFWTVPTRLNSAPAFLYHGIAPPRRCLRVFDDCVLVDLLPMTSRDTAPDLSHRKTEEEYLSAEVAAAEAVDVGRETLLVAAGQSEQIDNANRMADDAQYALGKSARLVRGMTWSGWVANLFTKGVTPPGASDASNPARNYKYEDLPESCQSAAQAILNYRCNVLTLETCETEEQKTTCLAVCDATYQVAAKEVSGVGVTHGDQLTADLSMIRHLQNGIENDSGGTASSDPLDSLSTNELTESISGALSSQPESGAAQKIYQDEHLKSLSLSLGELNSIGRSLGQEISTQNQLLDTVSEKADDNIDKSKLVTRKARRLVQAKAWKPVQKNFRAWYSIKHVATGGFLSVSNGSIVLSKEFHPYASVFGIWTRQGNVIGLQHRSTQQWVGQTLLGKLACNSNVFGKREEWEAYDDWNETRLCCCSANWGSGGFITSGEDGVLCLGDNASEKSKEADRWCFTEETGLR